MKQFFLALLLTATFAGFAQDKPKPQPPKQCKEFIASKGRQCLNPAKKEQEFCAVHDKTNQCKGTTQEGVQCRHKGKYDGYCHNHVHQNKNNQ